MFHHESGSENPFMWGKKIKSLGHEDKNSSGVGFCTLVSAGFFEFVSRFLL